MYNRRIYTIIIVVVLLASMTLTIREAVNTIALTRSIPVTGAAVEIQRVQRAQQADAQRWNAQAEKVTGVDVAEAARLQRARDAEISRLNAQAEKHSSINNGGVSRSQRAINAEISRWNALAEFYKK